LFDLCRLPNANHDTDNNIESYHDALKRWRTEPHKMCVEKRLVWLVWRLTIFIIFHYMYIEEQKFKDFIPNKKIEAIAGKGIEKTCNLSDDDVLQSTSLDNH